MVMVRGGEHASVWVRLQALSLQDSGTTRTGIRRASVHEWATEELKLREEAE